MRALGPVSLLVLVTVALSAKSHVVGTGQGSDDSASITATAYTDSASIKEIMGTDLDNHYILIKVEVTPQTGKTLRLDRDDFLLRTDKDGERTTPFAPSQITGAAALIVSRVIVNANGSQSQQNGPVWGGMPGTMGQPSRMPGNGGSVGNTAGVTENAAKMEKGDKDGAVKDDPLRDQLKKKELPQQEIGNQPASGYLYFPMEKQKLKDLELIYTTPTGKIHLRFR